jgi:hypothetical protein
MGAVMPARRRQWLSERAPRHEVNITSTDPIYRVVSYAILLQRNTSCIPRSQLALCLSS